MYYNRHRCTKTRANDGVQMILILHNRCRILILAAKSIYRFGDFFFLLAEEIKVSSGAKEILIQAMNDMQNILYRNNKMKNGYNYILK